MLSRLPLLMPSRLLMRSSSVSARLFHETSTLLRNNNSSQHNNNNNKTTTALVLGSSGALGTAVTRHFLQRGDVRVIGADVVDSAEVPQFHGFVPLPHHGQDNGSLGQVTKRLTEGVGACLGDDRGENFLDVIVVASGGWESDPEPHGRVGDNALAFGDSVDRMMRMNLHPVVAASYVAHYFMNPKKPSLFVVVGATAALSPTPGMMGYGMAKTATHHAVQTMGTMTGLALSTKAQRQQTKQHRQNFEALDNMTVVGILPSKLDTQSNRLAEPKADFSNWTRPSDIAKEIGDWMDQPHLRPHSGSLVKVFTTSEGGATFQLVR